MDSQEEMKIEEVLSRHDKHASLILRTAVCRGNKREVDNQTTRKMT